MAGRTTQIKVSGNVTEALAALEALGIKSEETARKTESTLGGAATRTGGLFSKLSQTLGNFGVPFTSSLGTMGGKLSETETKGKSFGQSLANVGKSVTLGLTAGIVGAGVESLKMAGNFQSAVTQLQTGAGESASNIKLVSDGLLKMAPAVGMGPEALAKAMFLVESAGFHGADGLKVMKAAAEGAMVGGADATVVANGLTTAMVDYNIPTSQAAVTTSRLVATVAAGKTNMQDLSSSLSAVLPAAAAAHVGLSQVLGAMGTMTGEGISAQQASQNLASTIRALSNPSSVASHEMAQMGLNSTTVAQQLGQKGLTGTLSELTSAITKHMGPSGLILQSSFNQSKLAAQSANDMLKKLPPSLQGLAKEFLNNQITAKQWTAALKGQDVLTSNLGKQFATVAKHANGFSDMLKSGSGAAQTYNAALSDMTGGATGLDTALALSGTNAATFAANVKTIGSTTTEAGGHVKGYGEVQKDVNQQLKDAKAWVESLSVRFGDFLIPKLESLVKVVQGVVDWFKQHKAIAEALGIVIGGVLTTVVTAFAVNTMAKMAKSVSDAVGSVSKLATGLKDLALKFAASGTASTASAAEVEAANATVAASGDATAASTEAATVRTRDSHGRFIASTDATATAAEEASASIAGSNEGISASYAATGVAAEEAAATVATASEESAAAASAGAAAVAAASEESAAASSAAFGPLGLVVGAVAIAGGLAAKALGLFGGSAHTQIKPTQDLTDAIQADSDAFGANTRKIVENSLESKGTFDAANRLGVSLKDVTDAAMGNAGAIGRVNAAVTAASAAHRAAWGDVMKLTNGLGTETTTLAINKQAVLNLNAANGGLGTSLAGAATQADYLNGALQGVLTTVGALNKAPLNLQVSAGASSIGSISHRASGGPVSAGSPYLVGEYGPELFVPTASGAIVPNGGTSGSASHSTAGAGTTINNNITAQTNANPQTIASEISWALRGYLTAA